MSDVFDTRRGRAPYPFVCTVIVVAGFAYYGAHSDGGTCSTSGTRFIFLSIAAVVLAMVGEAISAHRRGGDELVVLGWIVGTFFVAAPVIFVLTFLASAGACFS